MATHVAKVNDLKNELLNQIKIFCQSQAETWSQVPELALRANKARGFTCGRYSLAHSCNLWSVSSRDIHGLHVNLITGELEPLESLEKIQLNQISNLLEQLNALKVKHFIQNEIAKEA